MLTSLSASNASSTDYLKVFGVYKVSPAMPVVFKPEYTGYWSAFLRGREIGKLTEDSLLLAIIDFIQYMTHNKLDPYVQKSKIVKGDDILLDMITNQVDTYAASLTSWLRKTGVSFYLKNDARLIQKALDGKSILVNLKFKTTNSKETVLNLLHTSLKKGLFSGDVPLRLTQGKLKTFKARTTILNTQSNEWVKQTSIHGFIQVWVSLASDGLCIRVVIPVDTALIRKPKFLNHAVKVWKTVKL